MNTNIRRNIRKRLVLLWVLFTFLVVLLIGLFAINVFNEIRWFHHQVEHQNEQIKRQTELLQSMRETNMVFIMGQTLSDVESEMIQRGDKNLSQHTMDRIADLSHSFIPYRMMIGDSLSAEAYSPERGLLLRSLLRLKLDSASWHYLLRNASFARADLENAQLQGTDMRFIDLEGANLRGAVLDAADLRSANLAHADAWKSSMVQSRLDAAKLQYASLQWSSLNGSSMDSADLFGVNIQSTDLRNTSLIGVKMRWSNCRNALLSGARMQGIDLYGADLRDANLSQTQASDANFSKSDLTGAVLDSMNLSRANLLNASFAAPNWLDRLKVLKVIGADPIQEKYHVEKDLSKRSLYRLEIEGGTAID